MRTLKDLLISVEASSELLGLFDGYDDKDLSEFAEADDIRELFLDYVSPEQSEFIYHSDAIEYLAANDQTLSESMNIAQEYGFEPKSLNSCLLAQLLKESEYNELFYNDWDSIEAAFNALSEVEGE